MTESRRTPLYDLHVSLAGRMVDFAGWTLPVQYPRGVIAEHKWCREQAALFDVSHMAQIVLRGGNPAVALERLVPGGIANLAPRRARYTVFTNEEGGVLDDLIVTHAEDHLFLVVNASRAEQDLKHLEQGLAEFGVTIERLDRALIALQGPEAETALAAQIPACASLGFMQSEAAEWSGAPVRVTRCGYTGEDGFEISVAPDRAVDFAEALLADERVVAAGLGARDTLRLEACLPLYGQDIDETTTPVEAGLGWTIPKRRREAADFPGAEVILAQINNGTRRKLVAIRPEGRAPARRGAEIVRADRTMGEVTSGGFGPTVGGPVALGYVESEAVAPDTPLALMVRGQALPARVVASPFVPHRYKR